MLHANGVTARLNAASNNMGGLGEMEMNNEMDVVAITI